MSYTDKQGRTWHELDEATLPKDAQVAYATYRDANRVAAQAREDFEKVASKAMGDVRFGYNFGKLSFTPDGKPKAKSGGKVKMTLAQWQEQQAHI